MSQATIRTQLQERFSAILVAIIDYSIAYSLRNDQTMEDSETPPRVTSPLYRADDSASLPNQSVVKKLMNFHINPFLYMKS